jgi:hypothetical protein
MLSFVTSISKRRARIALALLLAAVSAVAANAVVLNPSDAFAVFGTTAAARPEVAGATIYLQVRAFEIRNAAGMLLYQGNLRSWVQYSNVTGKKIFYHRIEPSASGNGLPGVVDHLVTLGSYAGFSVDADYRTDLGVAGDIGLASVSRAAAPGSSVRPVFAGGIPAGGRSRPLFILTDANNYRAAGGTTWIVLSTGEWTTVVTPGPM